MAKPKFTPDPVPDGMDPQLAEYLSRQLNRIEDWWPKDYEERIQALEQLAPYCTGTWPIVDYSNITFESVAEITTVDVPCDPTSAVLDASYSYAATAEAGSSIWGITFNPAGTQMLAASTANGGLDQGMIYYTLSTPFDIGSLTYGGFVAEDGGWPNGAGFPWGIYAHPDGDGVFFLDYYVGGPSNPSWKGVVRYPFLINGDPSSMDSSPDLTKRIEGDVALPVGLSFSRDGLHFYTGDNTANSAAIHQWTMSTAWDVTSASYVGSIDLTTVSGFPASNYLVRAVSIDATGTNMVVNTQGGTGVFVLALATPFAISSISYTRTLTLTGTGDIYGMFVDSTCDNLIVNSLNNTLYANYALG